MVRIRSRWNVSEPGRLSPLPHRSIFPLQRQIGIFENVRNASADVAAGGFRNEMSLEVGVQSKSHERLLGVLRTSIVRLSAVDSNEYAVGRTTARPFHHDALRLDSRVFGREEAAR